MAGKQQTHCKRGHELTEENTEVSSSGRRCRICKNTRQRLTDSRPRQFKGVKKVCDQCGDTVIEATKSPFCKSCIQQRRRDKSNGFKVGLSGEEYRRIVDQAVEDQQGKCHICEQPFTNSPHFDHNHETGEFRGLLCFHCNTGLGHFSDDPAVLIRAASYLIERRNYGDKGADTEEGV